MRPAPRPALPRWSRRPQSARPSRFSNLDPGHQGVPEDPELSAPLSRDELSGHRCEARSRSAPLPRPLDLAGATGSAHPACGRSRPARNADTRSARSKSRRRTSHQATSLSQPGNLATIAGFSRILAEPPDVRVAVGADRDAHRPALRPPTRPARLLSELRRVRASGSHRSPWQVPPGTSRGRGPGSVASDQERERSGLKSATHSGALLGAGRLHRRPFPFGATTLWSRC
jgi:hypothetical protein